MMIQTDEYLHLNGIIPRMASQSTRIMKLNSKESERVTRGRGWEQEGVFKELHPLKYKISTQIPLDVLLPIFKIQTT